MHSETWLVGNLGKRAPSLEERDGPEGRFFVSSWSMATHEGKGDEQKTEWHWVQASGRQAEMACEMLRGGSSVIVKGIHRTHKYEDEDGVTRYRTYLQCRLFWATVPRGFRLVRIGGGENDSSFHGRPMVVQEGVRETPAAAEDGASETEAHASSGEADGSAILSQEQRRLPDVFEPPVEQGPWVES